MPRSVSGAFTFEAFVVLAPEQIFDRKVSFLESTTAIFIDGTFLEELDELTLYSLPTCFIYDVFVTGAVS